MFQHCPSCGVRILENEIRCRFCGTKHGTQGYNAEEYAQKTGAAATIFVLGSFALLMVTIAAGAVWALDEFWVEIPPGQFGVIKTVGQRDVQAEILPEGRHFINPFEVEKFEVFEMIEIPFNSIGIMTHKETGEQKKLRPGRHQINPHAWEVKIVNE